jgi:surfactin synthase thioesterase subunit
MFPGSHFFVHQSAPAVVHSILKTLAPLLLHSYSVTPIRAEL